MMTIDRGHREAMQRSFEASSGCLITEALKYKFQETSKEGFSENGDELHRNSINTESENSSNREASAPSNQGYSRPFYQQEFCMWHNFYPDGHALQQGQWANFGTHFYSMNREFPYPVDNRVHYMPFKMLYHNFPHEFQFQDFHYFVVIDFEATCDKERNPHPQEIIEFPSVVVNCMTGELESCFQTYVRPSYHQHLSDFCKELTGIQQSQVDRGVSLSEALLMHDKWLEGKGIKQMKFAVVTWSSWDCRVMLESECRFKRIRKPPYFNSWINLKVPFQEMFGVRCNLKNAIQLAGLKWEGRPHCGLDDARNTANLLSLLMRRGFRFSITDSLICPPVNLGVPPSPPQRPLKEPMMNAPPQFHTFVDPLGRDRCPYCYCGVRSNKGMVRRPGQMHGRGFYGCGNWTAGRRAVCNYFAWAS
ncbi:uncharacterized protein A4U43_C02F20040 [Asparagus officinalis]|uniref:GRF-type domain-containing protein n=1 Tax=Asparagus officinalis TaxID=4686 RepID=A0A5P1FLF4_ASPOF|nr:uncharacterized protein LOC109831735 [Asparagus officinalis]XP_020254722.1 uncharacterized protein LOC109831735 [Asparagus officinalis]ONK78553.1 uncharacterized protein A4U43_C02F20040 [Asparagus officinalis]